MAMKKKCYVRKYKEFPRQSGCTGQELVIAKDDGYSCTIDCVDKEVLDLSTIPVNTNVELDLLDYFKIMKCVSVNGKQFTTSVLALKVVGCNDIEVP